MATLAELLVKIGADSAQYEQKMKQVKRETSSTAADIKKSLGGISAAFGALTGGAIAMFAKSAIDGYIAQENAIKQLETRLKSTQSAAGKTSAELQDMAAALQKVTTYGDDAVIGMQGLLLTFTNIRGDVFDKATIAALDLSTALGQDLQSSAIQLGKALNDPTEGLTALKRVGVSFTDSQKEQIKALQDSGNLMGAQRIILAELTKEFGNSAIAARDTLGGALQALAGRFGEVGEAIAGLGGGNNAAGPINVLTDSLIGMQYVIEDLDKALASITPKVDNFFPKLANALPGGQIVGLIKFLELHGKAREEQEAYAKRMALPSSITFPAPPLPEPLKGKVDKGAAEKQLRSLQYETGILERDLKETIDSFAMFSTVLDTDPLAEWRDKYGGALDVSSQMEEDWYNKHAAWIVAVNESTSTLTEFQIEAYRNMQDAAADFFGDALDGQLDSFEDYASSFGKMVNKMVANYIADMTMAAAFGENFARGGELGGWIGAGLDLFSGMGGDGGASLTGTALDFMTPLVKPKALGGPVSANSPYMIGERGPELFVPNTAGRIVPNNQLGGGVNIGITIGPDQRHLVALLESRVTKTVHEVLRSAS